MLQTAHPRFVAIKEAGETWKVIDETTDAPVSIRGVSMIGLTRQSAMQLALILVEYPILAGHGMVH